MVEIMSAPIADGAVFRVDQHPCLADRTVKLRRSINGIIDCSKVNLDRFFIVRPVAQFHQFSLECDCWIGWVTPRHYDRSDGHAQESDDEENG